MEVFKGTPGPWSLDEFDNVVHGDAPSHGWGRKENVRVSGVSLPGRVTEEYSANTRLVSAAPELLDALQQLLLRVADDEEYGPDHAVTIARSAIAKALGK